MPAEALAHGQLPKRVTLRVAPDGSLSCTYALKVGASYATRGRMGCCIVVDTDRPGETASVHWSRFEPARGEEQSEAFVLSAKEKSSARSRMGYELG